LTSNTQSIAVLLSRHADRRPYVAHPPLHLRNCGCGKSRWGTARVDQPTRAAVWFLAGIAVFIIVVIILIAALSS
jgi:hypothetical protein